MSDLAEFSPLGDKVDKLSSIGDSNGGVGTLIDTGEPGGVGSRLDEGEAGGVAGAGGERGVGGVAGRSASIYGMPSF